MADTNNAHRKEVKVEDLLRLKRLERPDQVFWDHFDCELHQRMLQTLVKKDPWYVQLIRGISGRIAQTAAVGAAAAFITVMLVRPAFINSVEPGVGASFVRQSTGTIANASFELAISDFDTALTPDYQMEAIFAAAPASELGYTPEYAHDSIEVTAYDSSAYAMDTASFAGSSLATGLVY